MRARRLTEVLERLFPRYEPYAFTVNHKRQQLEETGESHHTADVGFFIHGLPRLTLRCRLLGHQPVVDGTPARRTGSYVSQAYLWVRCARCGQRGSPQGSLDPNVYQIGQRYRGPWDTRGQVEKARLVTAWKRGDESRPLLELPGPIGRPDGKVGGQLVIGGGYPGWEWEFKVGNRFSENTLAACLRLGRLGALYLHTEGFGMGLVTLLNGWSDTSKLTGMHCGDGRAGWSLWAHRWKGYEDNIAQGWWRKFEISLRLWDRVLGPKLYNYTDVPVPGEPVVRVVRMPERDYLVRLVLQRCSYGRARQWRARKHTWNVEWTAVAAGIPERPDDGWKGPITGSGVEVPAAAVHKGTWPAAAVAQIAVEMTRLRTRTGYDPVGKIPLVSRAEPS